MSGTAPHNANCTEIPCVVHSQQGVEHWSMCCHGTALCNNGMSYVGPVWLPRILALASGVDHCSRALSLFQMRSVLSVAGIWSLRHALTVGCRSRPCSSQTVLWTASLKSTAGAGQCARRLIMALLQSPSVLSVCSSVPHESVHCVTYTLCARC